MTEQHPITPPPELVEQWIQSTRLNDCIGTYPENYEYLVATQAARWGADQQLEKDAKWLDHNALNEAHLKTIPVGDLLKEAMRPKPPSLKEQALAALYAIATGADDTREFHQDLETIKQALESLPD